ncbi:DUF6412 domain-containing protein [Solwaraspora sp. WMMB335]|uniref:DUF6412 domain-containing protein n=1 Tax=Solwaraspora sp. WMMB335 TaxID=3404118 RepID=UPI003B96026D
MSRVVVILAGCWAYAYPLLSLAGAPPSHLAATAASVAMAFAVVLAAQILLGTGLPRPDAERLSPVEPPRRRPQGSSRQLDPDAPGRPRPRAPGRRLTAPA